MSTANKYHASGRLYTQTELRARRLALVKTYLVLGYDAKPKLNALTGLPVLQPKVLPYKRTEPRRHQYRRG